MVFHSSDGEGSQGGQDQVRRAFFFHEELTSDRGLLFVNLPHHLQLRALVCKHLDNRHRYTQYIYQEYPNGVKFGCWGHTNEGKLFLEIRNFQFLELLKFKLS